MKEQTKHTVFHHKQLPLTCYKSSSMSNNFWLKQIWFLWTSNNAKWTSYNTRHKNVLLSSFAATGIKIMATVLNHTVTWNLEVLQLLNLPVSCGHQLTADTADFRFSFHPYAEAKAGLIDTEYRSCSYLEPGPLWHTYVAKGRSCWTCSDWCQSCYNVKIQYYKIFNCI